MKICAPITMHHRRREAERGLVEHDELGLAHKAAADREHLLLAARHRAGKLLAALGEPRKQLEGLVERAPRLLARARQHRAHLQVLEHAERWKDLPAFGHLA